LESRIKLREAAYAPYRFQYPSAQEWIARNVHTVPGREQHMINAPLSAVTQFEDYLLADWRSRDD